ncbi:MAG: glycosyltransferase [Bacteroidota bacterium]|nr:glycosyltransferase [Bacteroidota bacterium]
MKYILYVGFPGFPVGLAQIKRQLLIAKGLTETGCSVRVFNRVGTHKPGKDPPVFIKGTFEGIEYEYCSGTPYRPTGFVKRNLLKGYGLFNELKLIASCRRNHKADAIIISSNVLWELVYYTLLAKLLRIRSVFDAVEYWSTPKKGIAKFALWLKNRLYIDLADRIFVISDYLYDRVIREKPGKPILRVPPLCDFNLFVNPAQGCTRAKRKSGFLFCGSLAYSEVIYFIIEAYRKLNTDTGLVIIASGDRDAELEKLKEAVNREQSDHITLLNNITDEELIRSYKNSIALLIPMRPTIQDIARFPHKIGEYTAAARPIVSTNIGEIKNFFKDGVNAFVADSYDTGAFSFKMKEILEKPELADEIGRQGFQTGLQHFDYRKNGVMIYDFLFNSGNQIQMGTERLNIIPS